MYYKNFYIPKRFSIFESLIKFKRVVHLYKDNQLKYLFVNIGVYKYPIIIRLSNNNSMHYSFISIDKFVTILNNSSYTFSVIPCV